MVCRKRRVKGKKSGGGGQHDDGLLVAVALTTRTIGNPPKPRLRSRRCRGRWRPPFRVGVRAESKSFFPSLSRATARNEARPARAGAEAVSSMRSHGLPPSFSSLGLLTMVAFFPVLCEVANCYDDGVSLPLLPLHPLPLAARRPPILTRKIYTRRHLDKVTSAAEWKILHSLIAPFALVSRWTFHQASV